MYNNFSDITKEVSTLENERKVTTLRIEIGMYKEIAKLAIDEGRTANAQILYMLRQALDQRKAQSD